MYLFLFLTLYMFRAHRAHHQERQIVSVQPLVTVTLCWWPCRVQVGSDLSSYTCTRHGHQHEVGVLTQFVSPDDEHDVLETCRELKIKIHRKEFVRHVGHLPRMHRCVSSIMVAVANVILNRKLLWQIYWLQLPGRHPQVNIQYEHVALRASTAIHKSVFVPI